MGVDSVSNRNEYQEYFLAGKDGRYVRLTTLKISCADCFEILEPEPPGNFRASPACNMIALPFTNESRNTNKITLCAMVSNLLSLPLS